MTDLPYRRCVGVVLADREGRVFAGERIDTPGAWQMPQGGIDKGETAEGAALREVEEETGVSPSLVHVEAEHPDAPAWISYDLPDHLIGKVWGGKYRGQSQKWFLLRFLGKDSDIDITRHDKEFARWRWSSADDVLSDIVPFKRDVYIQVIEAFRPHL